MSIRITRWAALPLGIVLSASIWAQSSPSAMAPGSSSPQKQTPSHRKAHKSPSGDKSNGTSGNPGTSPGGNGGASGHGDSGTGGTSTGGVTGVGTGSGGGK
jgi:hypothetical protein